MYKINPEKDNLYRKLYKPHANASGVTSFDKEHVANFLRKIAPEFFMSNDVYIWIIEIPVSSISINDILSQQKITGFDIVQIDTEGYDFEIVKMIFSEFQRDPVVLNLEFKHIPQKDHSILFESLYERNYSLFRHKGDLCAFKELDLSIRP